MKPFQKKGGKTVAKIYICSPYRAKTEEGLKDNIGLAKRMSRYAAMKGHTVLCPHLLYPRFLDDDNEQEREIGIQSGLELLKIADEVWVASGRISEGMSREIAKAGELGIPVQCIVDPQAAEEHLLNTVMLGKE
jgi:hypothetical protein